MSVLHGHFSLTCFKLIYKNIWVQRQEVHTDSTLCHAGLTNKRKFQSSNSFIIHLIDMFGLTVYSIYSTLTTEWVSTGPLGYTCSWQHGFHFHGRRFFFFASYFLKHFLQKHIFLPTVFYIGKCQCQEILSIAYFRAVAVRITTRYGSQIVWTVIELFLVKYFIFTYSGKEESCCDRCHSL